MESSGGGCCGGGKKKNSQGAQSSLGIRTAKAANNITTSDPFGKSKPSQ